MTGASPAISLFLCIKFYFPYLCSIIYGLHYLLCMYKHCTINVNNLSHNSLYHAFLHSQMSKIHICSHSISSREFSNCEFSIFTSVR